MVVDYFVINDNINTNHCVSQKKFTYLTLTEQQHPIIMLDRTCYGNLKINT